MNRTIRKSVKVRSGFQDQLQEMTTKMNKMIELHDQLMIERTNEERHIYKSNELDKQIDSLCDELDDLRGLLESESNYMDESEYKNNHSMVDNIESILRATKRKIKEGLDGLGIREVGFTKNSGHFGIEKTFAGNVITGIFIAGVGYYLYQCTKK